MKISINDVPFTVQFLDSDNEKLHSKKHKQEYLGLTECLPTCTIYIRKGMDKETTRQTVIHELVHAFIFAFGYELDGEESVCNLFGAQADKIMSFADEIMAERGSENVT